MLLEQEYHLQTSSTLGCEILLPEISSSSQVHFSKVVSKNYCKWIQITGNKSGSKCSVSQTVIVVDPDLHTPRQSHCHRDLTSLTTFTLFSTLSVEVSVGLLTTDLFAGSRPKNDLESLSNLPVMLWGKKSIRPLLLGLPTKYLLLELNI